MGIRPMLLIQCIGIVGAVVTQTATHLNFSGHAPDERLIAVNIIWSLFVAWWVGSVIVFRWRRWIAEDTPDGWYFHSLGIFWSGNAATIASFFLLVPWATLEWVLLSCAFCLAPMILEAIGTVRSPRFGPRPWLALLVPSVLPIVLGAYLITRDEPHAREMGLFYFLFLLLLLFLRELIQGVVNRLEIARAEAERERDARTRFLATVSHDLAQPMQAARLFFEQALQLGDGPPRDAAIRNANLAFDSTERMLDQTLQRLRLDAGAVKASMQVVSVGSALRTATEQARLLAGLEGIELRCINSRLNVWADPDLVDRILGNLVGNALRHARAKRVLIGARRHHSRVHLWVIDDGVGIPKNSRMGLFDAFVQGDQRTGSAQQGFGLGLYAARTMARLMDADLTLADPGERGAAFRLDLALV